MNQREAKIIALRKATALLNGGLDQQPEKVLKELEKLALEFEKRAKKLGGDFNVYTGD